MHANKYAIVNHTRNVKGYICLRDVPYELEQGQLVVGCVQSSGTSEYNVQTSGNKNRKLQLSLDPVWVNRGFDATKVTPGMLLQGVVESKELKGYVINLGFKDQAKGFVQFETAPRKLTVGNLVHVVVKS